MARVDPTLATLRAHEVPAWWRAAKLGIFVHWTPASVAGFAPAHGDYGELLTSGRRDAFSYSPYTEWYQNSLRFPGSPVAQHHAEVWGDRPYEAFAADFEVGLATWDPEAWARAFADTGAGYVVLVAKHHDGWCLWPSEIENPRKPGWHSSRDLVGELASAVRAAGMRFGVYYSGGLDWTFCDTPMGSMGSMIQAIPSGDYPAYAEAQVRELIERYEPSVLWNDIAWPAPGRELWPLMADYYAAVPDGVLNDRWMPWSGLLAMARTGVGRRLIDWASRRQADPNGGMVPPRPPHFDVRTPEYTTFDEIQTTAWECVRGMDHSFGYNAESAPEDFLAREDLVGSVVDIAAKGGNLLLNVGPRGVDATIPEEQLVRLGWLAEFAPTLRGALQGSTTWILPGTSTAEGDWVRYVGRDEDVVALLRPSGTSVTLIEVVDPGGASAATIDGRTIDLEQVATGLRLDLGQPSGVDPVAIVLTGVKPAPPVS
jgi:alpha-L-fucosidase